MNAEVPTESALNNCKKRKQAFDSIILTLFPKKRTIRPEQSCTYTLLEVSMCDLSNHIEWRYPKRVMDRSSPKIFSNTQHNARVW